MKADAVFLPTKETPPDTEWRTPRSVFEFMNTMYGPFTLDAASNGKDNLVDNYLTGPCYGNSECQCGLCASWDSHRVFLNPPFGRGLNEWVKKAATCRAPVVASILPLSPNTKYWWEYAITRQTIIHPICNGRVEFDVPINNPDIKVSSNRYNVALVIFGDEVRKAMERENEKEAMWIPINWKELREYQSVTLDVGSATG